MVESNGGLFLNTTNNINSIGGCGQSTSSNNRNFGIKGWAAEYRGSGNYGVFGTTVNFPTLLAGKMNVGVYGYAARRSHPTSTHVNYAVVGDLGPTCVACTSGTPAGLGDFAGYFNGDIFTTNGFYAPSDENFKDNIQDIINALDVINSLNPKSYTYKQADNLSMIFPEGTHYGICAQNVASVIPSAVKNVVHPARFDSLGNETYPEINLLAVNNTEIIPFLVAAIKDQQQIIEAIQTELAILNGGGNRQGHNGSGDEENTEEKEEQGNSKSINIELTNAKAIILNQNVPNPFAEQTSISYFVTDEVKKAQIFFYDNRGTILKIVDINEKGPGQINVFAADLSSGNYTYTLIADGKVIETKTMVKQ